MSLLMEMQPNSRVNEGTNITKKCEKFEKNGVPKGEGGHSKCSKHYYHNAVHVCSDSEIKRYADTKVPTAGIEADLSKKKDALYKHHPKPHCTESKSSTSSTKSESKKDYVDDIPKKSWFAWIKGIWRGNIDENEASSRESSVSRYSPTGSQVSKNSSASSRKKWYEKLFNRIGKIPMLGGIGKEHLESSNSDESVSNDPSWIVVEPFLKKAEESPSASDNNDDDITDGTSLMSSNSAVSSSNYFSVGHSSHCQSLRNIQSVKDPSSVNKFNPKCSISETSQRESSSNTESLIGEVTAPKITSELHQRLKVLSELKTLADIETYFRKHRNSRQTLGGQDRESPVERRGGTLYNAPRSTHAFQIPGATDPMVPLPTTPKDLKATIDRQTGIANNRKTSQSTSAISRNTQDSSCRHSDCNRAKSRVYSSTLPVSERHGRQPVINKKDHSRKEEDLTGHLLDEYVMLHKMKHLADKERAKKEILASLKARIPKIIEKENMSGNAILQSRIEHQRQIQRTKSEVIKSLLSENAKVLQGNGSKNAYQPSSSDQNHVGVKTSQKPISGGTKSDFRIHQEGSQAIEGVTSIFPDSGVILADVGFSLVCKNEKNIWKKHPAEVPVESGDKDATKILPRFLQLNTRKVMDQIWGRIRQNERTAKQIIDRPSFLNCHNLEMVVKDGKLVKLGTGTYGEVYLAKLASSKMLVAIKLFYRSVNTHEDVLFEGSLLVRINSLGTTPFFFGLLAFEKNDKFLTYGIVTEFIGDTDSYAITDMKCLLNQHQKESRGNRLSKQGWLHICKDVMSALNAIHAKGIVMNDIKFDNILLQKLPNRHRVYLIDFGIASLTNGNKELQFTIDEESPEAFLKKYNQIAPELVYTKKSGPKSDIYGFGYLLIQMSNILNISQLKEIGKLCRAREAENRPSGNDLMRRLEHSIKGMKDRKTLSPKASKEKKSSSPRLIKEKKSSTETTQRFRKEGRSQEELHRKKPN